MIPTLLNVRRFGLAVLGLCLVSLAGGLAGCSEYSPPAAAATGPAHQYWDVVTMQGARVGYVQTTVTPQTRNGRTVLHIEGKHHMAFQRAGQKGEQDLTFSSIETPEGGLVEFTAVAKMGPVESRTTGRVVDRELRLETTTLGRTERQSLPWSDDYGGLYAMELSLRRQPMKPGEKRTLHGLMPGFYQRVRIDLVAEDYERVALPSGTHELLKVQTVIDMLNGQKMPGVNWVDRTGEVLKGSSDLMQLASYRTTRADALDEKELGKVDLMIGTSIKPDRPLVNAHRTQRVRYRLELQGGDPAAVFVSGPSQTVKSIDANTAEITVTAIRPGQAEANAATRDDPVTKADLAPNNSIQCDDPEVVALAKQAAGDEKAPWKTVVALERFVRGFIHAKDFSQAFATAAEVARSKEGDCTEHAVLLAALCRARGIPARVAVGLVYVERDKAFFYHMWTEANVGGQWIAVDATLAQGGIGAAHLKLAHSNLQGTSAFASFLPVVEVMGRLKIAVLEQEP